MIKLLLLSYHSLPMDVVASYRTKAYCDYLLENGIFPTLITHRWEKDENSRWQYHDRTSKIKLEEYQNYKVIRLPRPRPQTGNKISTFFNLLKGNLDIELINSYKMFRDFLFEHLKSDHYDFILAIYSPHHHLKLAFEIKKKFRIPYVLDFRDLWDNQIVTKSYNPSHKKKILDYITQAYWTKWLRHAEFFTTTGYKWRDFLHVLSRTKGYIVANGHESDLFPGSQKTSKFTLAYFGRVYPQQNLSIINNGIKKFLNKCRPERFKVQLIGIKNTINYKGVESFLSEIPGEFVEVIEYLPKPRLIEHCLNHVSIFILPNFDEDNGQFMVKLYDYIALGKPVIIAPKIDSDTEKVLQLLQMGIATSDEEEIAEFIETKYDEFLNNGFITVTVKKEFLNQYHRKCQVRNLGRLINDKYHHAIL